MLRIFALGMIVMALSTPSVAAELCDDLWFSRNLVFDQAGYCFGSTLGQAVFDNGDCTTKTPELSADNQAFVDWVKGVERQWDCNVDTARTQINVESIDTRRQLVDPVAASPFSNACIGYTGPRLPLYAGRDFTSRVIGFADPGFDIHWEFEWVSTIDGWDFITVRNRNGLLLNMGWARAFIGPENCRVIAG